MTVDDFPEAAPARPLWLMTLADLALLLVGFLVLVQATTLDRAALAKGLREGFGVAAAAADAMPVAAAAVTGFAAGSSALPHAPAALIRWARAAAADPRVSLRIAGSTAGSGDVDPATGSAAILAADRARAVAAALARAGVAPDRLVIVNAPARERRVLVTLAFAGDRP